MGSRSVNTRLIRPHYGQAQGIVDGRDVNATNTGIAKHGLVQANLTAMAGGALSTSGNTYTERVLTSQLDIFGNNNTFIRCLFKPSGGASGHCVEVEGTGNTFIDCTVTTSSGSLETGIRVWGEGSGTTIRGCDLSNCENLVGFNDENAGSVLEESYLHDANNSTTGGHIDGMEVYGSTNLTIRRNRIVFAPLPTAAINIAPYAVGSYVDGCDIYDNFIDGGQNNILVDLQDEYGALYLRNVRVYRNWMGGHQYVQDGRYSAASLRAPNNVTCETLAAQVSDPNKVYWPTSGSEVNRWWDCADLVPDLSGQIVIP